MRFLVAATFLSALGCGLMAGFFFAFSATGMKALGLDRVEPCAGSRGPAGGRPAHDRAHPRRVTPGREVAQVSTSHSPG